MESNPSAETPTASNDRPPKRGDVIDLTIEDWGDKGKGIARHGRIVVLTDRGLPGDRARVRIQGRRKRFLHGAVTEILEPSPDRVDPPCRHFGLCGGCRLQDLAYPRQLQDKVRHLKEQIRRIGGETEVPDVEAIGCEPPYHYRNKMEFSFGGTAGAGLELGLHPRDNFRDVFNLLECHLTDPRVSRVVEAVRRFFAGGNEAPYHPVAHTGFLRFVVVRIGFNTGDLLVNLVTADAPWPRSREFASFFKDTCPEITTALWTTNPTRANVATGTVQTIYFGPGSLREKLGPFEFEIAPTGFFQTNTRQAERLFQTVVEWATGDGTGEVLDLYSGAGAISLFLSRRAARVIGVEIHEESVEAARRNARRNGIDNCEFLVADALAYLREHAAKGTLPATVVLDPPRAGLHPKAVRTLIETRPARIIYVSCNPPAFARDWESLRRPFKLTRLAAVDMFPHTPHVEAVACLQRRDPA